MSSLSGAPRHGPSHTTGLITDLFEARSLDTETLRGRVYGYIEPRQWVEKPVSVSRGLRAEHSRDLANHASNSYSLHGMGPQ